MYVLAGLPARRAGLLGSLPRNFVKIYHRSICIHVLICEIYEENRNGSKSLKNLPMEPPPSPTPSSRSTPSQRGTRHTHVAPPERTCTPSPLSPSLPVGAWPLGVGMVRDAEGDMELDRAQRRTSTPAITSMTGAPFRNPAMSRGLRARFEEYSHDQKPHR